MDVLPVIRSLVELRTRDRVPKEALARMTAAELRARPEATIAAIVDGWYEFRANGYADADIYREIEGRRSQAYGDEPLPADLTLDTYTRYRMRLEHPAETALHDMAYVMQAVSLVSAARERAYGPGGTPVAFSAMTWVETAMMVYAAFVLLLQGLPNALLLLNLNSRLATDRWLAAPLLALAIAVALGVFGYCGRASWGRVAIKASLVAEVVFGWGALAYLVLGDRGVPPVWGLHIVNTIVALAFVAFVHGRERDASRPAPGSAR